MSDKHSLTVKSFTDSDQAVLYLEALTAGLRAGTICLQRGDERITLKPGNAIAVEIDARSRKRKESLEIELSWSVETPPSDPSDGVVISATAPEAQGDAVE